MALRVRWRKGDDGHKDGLTWAVAAMRKLLLLPLPEPLLQEHSGRRREAAPLRRMVMAGLIVGQIEQVAVLYCSAQQAVAANGQ